MDRILTSALGLPGAIAIWLLAGPDGWLRALGTPFLPHLGAALSLLAVAACMARGSRLRLLLAAPFAAGVLATWLMPAAPMARPADGLVAVGYNTLWRQDDPEDAEDWLRAQPADLVLLVEVDGDWDGALKRLAKSYPYQAREAYGGHEMVLLARHPVRVAASDPVPGSSRHPVRFEVEIDGRRIAVVGVHAPVPTSPEGWRRREAYLEALAGLLRELSGPVIVLGDFNATRFDDVLRRLVGAAGLEEVPVWATWPVAAGGLGIAIDHIFAGGGARVLETTVGPAIGSDHRPLVARIGL